ncbi:MAG TPA: hypothetical protein VGF82_15380 [Terracidiphilus sp.]|jgi:hypothetical protein
MYMTCRHIKTNGIQCGSPALKGGNFCHFHSKNHTLRDEVKFGPLQLPVPEDAASIMLSIARINEAILTGCLDLKKANLILSGLKLAARFIDPKKYFDAHLTVQTIQHDMRGEELAEPKYVCDDEDDCNDCPYSDPCPRCLHTAVDNTSDEQEEEEEEEVGQEQNELPILQAVAAPTRRVPQVSLLRPGITYPLIQMSDGKRRTQTDHCSLIAVH